MATKTANIKGPAGNQGASGATGTIGPPGLPTLSATSGNTAKLGSDSLLYTPNPLAPLASGAPGILKAVSGNTSDFVDGTGSCQNLGNAISPTIWSIRQRTCNLVDNPTFEVNQRAPGQTNNGISGGWYLDRWPTWCIAGITAAQTQGRTFLSGSTQLVSAAFLRFTVNTQKPSLAATDLVQTSDYIEGPKFYKVSLGHSVTLVARCTQPISFSFNLCDTGAAYSYSVLCQITVPNTVTVFQIPNLSWSGSSTFSTGQGQVVYQFRICLAAGTSYLPSANNAWVASNTPGAVGMSNFCGLPVGTTFDLLFCQDEPSYACNGLIYPPSFADNLLGCQRYYAKSSSYGNLTPVAADWRMIGEVISGTVGRCLIQFPVEMAKAPIMKIWDNQTTLGSVFLDAIGSVGSASLTGVTTKLIEAVNFASTPTAVAGMPLLGQWTADTQF